MIQKEEYLVINHFNDVFSMFIRMLVTAHIASEQSNYIHPKSASPQVPIQSMTRAMVMISLPMTVKKSFAHQKSIQPDCFANFTLAFLVEQVLFNNIEPGCSESRSKISTEICSLTILTTCIDEILKQKAKFA
jgi:high-affinity K+ transport system ATPase subunit B